MKRRQFIFQTIDENISQEIRVSFVRNLRTNVYGNFVKHEDHEYLKSKGLVRFLSHIKRDVYNEAFNKDVHTLILCVDDFKLFDVYSEPGIKTKTIMV